MRNLFELLSYFKDVLFLLLVVIISVVLLITGESTQSLSLQRGYAEIAGSLPRINLRIDEYLSYRAENDLLRQRLMRYTLLNAELAEVARENRRLKEMLHFAKDSPYVLQAAEVVNRGASSVLSTITINAGRVQGVSRNQPVLTINGLLGKTMNVSENASIIHLVTDRNFRLSVKVGALAVRGILLPVVGTVTQISGIPPNAPITVGDQVLTSGFSDIYPRDLPVGVIRSVEYIPGDNFSQVRVDLYTNPAEAEHVFVIVGDGSGF